MNESVIYNFNQESFEEAIRVHEDDIAEFGEIEGNAEYYYCLGKSYQELGDIKKSRKFYELILDKYYDYGKYDSLASIGIISIIYESGLDEQVISKFNSLYFDTLLEVNYIPKDLNLINAIEECIKIIQNVLEKGFNSNNNENNENHILKKKTENNKTILEVVINIINYRDKAVEELLEILLNQIENPEPETIKIELVLKLFLKYFHNNIINLNDNEILKFINKYQKKIVVLTTNTMLYIYDNEWSYFLDFIRKAFTNGFYKLLTNIFENFGDYEPQVEVFPNDILFYFGYSAASLNKKDLAKNIYEYYLEKYGSTPSVCNNLGSIYKEEKNLEESIKLFKLSIEGNSKESIYFFNLGDALIDTGDFIEAFKIIREGQKLDPKNTRIKPLIDKLPKMYNDRYPNSELSNDQQNKLNEYYWSTDISTTEIKKSFNIPDTDKEYFAFLIYPYYPCPNCNSNLVYKSRSSKNDYRIACENCNHKQGRCYSINNCSCEYCKKLRLEKYEKERIIKENEFNEKVRKAGTPEFIKDSISQLNFTEKIFAKAMFELVNSEKSFTFEDVCRKASINLNSIDIYKKKLLSVSLLFIDLDNNYIVNPAVESSMIKITYPLIISDNNRFNIIKRDKHTCRYCGRKPPEVELDIDYDLPVTEGGTENIDNLITLCRQCKIGKNFETSENDISDEWQQIIKKREEDFEDIKKYWSTCMSYKFLDYDEEVIRNLIKKYNPIWIKKAIKITSEKDIKKYGNYISAIIKNWEEKGFPEDKLAQKMATENQILYIEDLLKKNNINLKEYFGKEDINSLTMLDAKNIIEDLT